jgi:hypothetical protein
MRLRSTIGGAAAIAWVLAASTVHSQSPVRIDPAACWRFEIVSEPGPRQPTSLIPPYAMLSDSSTSAPSQFAVRRLNHDGTRRDTGRRTPLSTWSRHAAGDSVQVTFTEGFARYLFVLALPSQSSAAHADTLYGRADFWSDNGPALFAKGAAHAVRVACPPPRAGA